MLAPAAAHRILRDKFVNPLPPDVLPPSYLRQKKDKSGDEKNFYGTVA